MLYYTEASNNINKKPDDKFTKKGIKVVSSIQSTDDNVIIDGSKISTYDQSYIKRLISMAEKISKYDQRIIYIPVSAWMEFDYKPIIKSNSPLGHICRYIKSNPTDFKNKFNGFIFVFYNKDDESMALYVDDYKSSEFTTFMNSLTVITTSHASHSLTGEKAKTSTVKDVVDKDKLEKDVVETKKKELVDAVAKAAEDSENEDEAWDKLDSEDIAKLIAELEEEDDGKPKFNAARSARIAKLDDEYLEKKINGKSVKDLISEKEVEIKKDDRIKVSSINDEWKDVHFTEFQDAYNIDDDIAKILQSFSHKSYPISVLDINVEDTSTNMDYVNTYTVKMEDGFGKRFTVKFDIPKFKNKRFMRLRGNEKTISGQLVLLPCQKTDADTVQCVSNYKKIFLRRFGMQGKSYPAADKFIKTIRKMPLNKRDFKIYFGDNSAICSKYDLPVDYIDIASQVNRIETPEYIFYFNQDEYYTKYKADISKGIPFAVNKHTGDILYYNKDIAKMKEDSNVSLIMSEFIGLFIADINDDFKDIYVNTKPAARLNYSQASIMASKIPLAVVIGYSIGMTRMVKLFTGKGINVADKKSNIDTKKYDYIRFSDGYLCYPRTYSNSMLFNGLAVCPTENYSLADIDKRSMWLDFLDNFGGRILADGLDNFEDLFMDPITEEVCNHIGIPSDYFGMLKYANDLLADNKYNRHTDIRGNRYRTNELIAGYFYQAICKSYEEYKAQMKRGRKVGMTMKQSAVIDLIFKDPTFGDLSILNPLLEIEAANSATFMGLSGMNSSRSYSLDKRTYDDSMINKLALSTGFAANVGINRQTTIDMDVDTKRGYIKNTGVDDASITKSFSMTEAVTPFGTTRDDPFRSAMTFIQTSKHGMRTAKSMPLLITNGADEAMPYISSDTFAYKAKENGVVTELTDEYMIVTYDKPVTIDGKSYLSEAVDLRENVKKNSDGGFYITIKLDTDLKVDKKFKKGEIIAYDRTSYSNKNGEDNNLSYNLGVLAKVAIMNTDEGFEDSTSVSSWLSDAMATDVVVQDEKDISKNTNVYSMVKVGQEVQEGDPLIIFQNSYDEKDANMLLKNITDTDFVSDLGRIRLKSHYTGVIQDIKIYRTCELAEMSDSLKKIVNDYEKGIRARKKMYEKYKIPGANTLDPDYKMQATGIMKNNPDGVKIVFYIKYNDKLSVGDKTVAQSANKGVVKNIFPEGMEPFSEYRPEEKIHALYAARSFNARMVTSVWTSGAINKCMIELDRQVKEIMGIPWKPLEEME